MKKLSQVELISEFNLLGALRMAGRAAKAVGSGVKAVAQGVHALDPEGFNAISAPLTTLAKPIVGVGKGIAAAAPTSYIKSKFQWTDSYVALFVKDTLKKDYATTFNTKSIKIGDVKLDGQLENIPRLPKQTQPNTSRKIVTFQAERFKPTGNTIPNETYYAFVIKLQDGLTMDVRDRRGRQIAGEKTKGKKYKIKDTSPTPTPTPPAATATLPKYYESLKEWKIQNIGPQAATVGITREQMKEFLKTLNVQDPDRIMDQAGVTHTNAIVSNILQGRIKNTLQSRGIISENSSSQIELISQLKKCS